MPQNGTKRSTRRTWSCFLYDDQRIREKSLILNSHTSLCSPHKHINYRTLLSNFELFKKQYFQLRSKEHYTLWSMRQLCISVDNWLEMSAWQRFIEFVGILLQKRMLLLNFHHYYFDNIIRGLSRENALFPHLLYIWNVYSTSIWLKRLIVNLIRTHV